MESAVAARHHCARVVALAAQVEIGGVPEGARVARQALAGVVVDQIDTGGAVLAVTRLTLIKVSFAVDPIKARLTFALKAVWAVDADRIIEAGRRRHVGAQRDITRPGVHPNCGARSDITRIGQIEVSLATESGERNRRFTLKVPDANRLTFADGHAGVQADVLLKKRGFVDRHLLLFTRQRSEAESSKPQSIGIDLSELSTETYGDE